jgi:two-component system, OmpR family, alkaline phosphatase synthesis response regulator PhoP
MSEETKKKVLIAEDEQTLLKTIEFTLKDKGYETITATDGEEALKQIKEQKPDVVLLDILMPRKSGLDVLKEMKADDELSDIVVLLLTNLSDEESISQGVALGARGYFVKSDMTLDEVAEKVEEVVS